MEGMTSIECIGKNQSSISYSKLFKRTFIFEEWKVKASTLCLRH